MITQLSKQGEPLGTREPEAERILCDPASDPGALADLLLRLHQEQVWLCCGCGWIFHCRGGHTLARNPRQAEPDGEPCALCRAWPYRGRTAGSGARAHERVKRGIRLISTARRRTGAEPSRAPVRGGGGPSRMPNARMFQVLRSVITDAGFTGLPGPLETAVLWRRVREVLALSPLHPDDVDGLSFADLAWTAECAESPHEILSRVAAEWTVRDVAVQVWIIALVDQVPRAEGGRVRFRIDGAHDEVEIDVDARRSKVIGRLGPHLVLVQATRAPDGGIRCDKLAALAVLDLDCPVPVDSSHEREVIRTIQALELRYYKPCYAYVDDLTPDVMLLDLQVLIEVQGMRIGGYAEHKAEVHRRMCAHPALRGWRLLTYDPHQETLRELQRRLRGWWRGDTATRRRT